MKVFEVVCLPGFAAVESLRQKIGDRGRSFESGARIEEEGARAPGKHVFDGARHLVPCRPNHLAQPEGQARMQQGIEAGV